MAKRSGKYICNRCGGKIDTAHDLDCNVALLCELQARAKREKEE